MSRMTKDAYYLNIALAVSKRSTCLKRHYGCIIVKDDRIVATGYNGSPRGEVNCCDIGVCKRANAERYSDYTLCESVHAEQNAILSASSEELKDAVIYLACEEKVESKHITQTIEKGACVAKDYKWIEDTNPIPCPLCERMIKNANIAKVINGKGIVYSRK